MVATPEEFVTALSKYPSPVEKVTSRPTTATPPGPVSLALSAAGENSSTVCTPWNASVVADWDPVTVKGTDPDVDEANPEVPANVADSGTVPAAGAVTTPRAMPLGFVVATTVDVPSPRVTGTPATPTPPDLTLADRVTWVPEAAVVTPRTRATVVAGDTGGSWIDTLWAR